MDTLREDSQLTSALLALISEDWSDQAEDYNIARAYEYARPVRQLILTIRNSLGREEIRNAKSDLRRQIELLEDPDAIVLVMGELEKLPHLQDFYEQLSVRQTKVAANEKFWAGVQEEMDDRPDIELEMMELDRRERQLQQEEDARLDRLDLHQDGKPARIRPGRRVPVNLGGVTEMTM